MFSRTGFLALALLIGGVGISYAEDAPTTPATTPPTSQPTTSPAVLAPTDTAGITAKKGEVVTVEGLVDTAAWSSSGKVMNITFKDVEKDKGLLCSAFQKNKAKLDAEFEGDAAAKLTGAKIQITGKVEIYGGKIAAWKDRPEIVIQNPQQIKVIEPAPK